jgi:hypothetical protein
MIISSARGNNPLNMEKGKSIVKVQSNSLGKVTNQISLVSRILSKKQKRISATRRTPEVILDKEGIIKMRGRSIPDDALAFFKPIEEWVNEYIGNPADITYVDFNFEIIHSDSSKYLVTIIQKISLVVLKHKKFKINWYYEDGKEEILEIGKYLAEVLDIPFNLIKIT